MVKKQSKRDIYVESNKAIDELLNSRQSQLDREFKETLNGIKLALAEAYEKFGKDGILTREEMVKYNRLSKFEQYLLEQIQDLNKRQIQLTKDTIQDIFIESYYRYGYMIENETEFQIYKELSKHMIQENISNELDPIGWEERARINNDLMLRQIKQDLYEAFAVGVAYEIISRQISKRMEVGSNKGKNIVRKEGRRVQESANYNAMDDADEELSKINMSVRKQWVSAKDSRVRDTHQHLDGEIIELDEKFVSKSGATALAPKQFGVMSEDANCRCTAVHAFFDENGERIGGRTMRARNHGDRVMSSVVPYQRYSDWLRDLKKRK